jgi:hypothetical protein
LGKFWIVTGTINISNLYNNYTISRAYKKNQDIIFESHNIVLKYKRITSAKEINSLESKNKFNLISPNGIYARLLVVNPLETANNIYLTGLSEYAKQNFFFRIKPAYTLNAPYYNGSGITNADMVLPETWNITKGDSNFIIAAIIKGITLNHPELQNSW